MCDTKKTSQPDTASQDAEIARQNQILIENANNQAAEERRRYEEQRAADQKRYEDQLAEERRIAEQQRQDQLTAAERQRQENLAEAERQRQLQQAEQDRQYAAQQEYLRQLRAEQAAQQEEQRRVAQAQRDYSTGRQNLINDNYGRIDQAYAGFDDAYFNKFAQDFTDYFKPQLEREYRGERRDTKYAYADAGTLKSSMAAGAFGELQRKKAVGEGEIASNAQDQVLSLRAGLDQQKSAAKNQILSAATAANPALFNSGDVSASLSGLGSQLTNLAAGAQTAAGKMKAVVPTTGGFTTLASAVRKPVSYGVA